MYTASMKPFGYTDPIYQIRYGLKKTLKISKILQKLQWPDLNRNFGGISAYKKAQPLNPDLPPAECSLTLKKFPLDSTRSAPF